MTNLWSANHPRSFWQLQTELSESAWEEAIIGVLHRLGLEGECPEIDGLLYLTLGEGRFGPEHWTLSIPTRIYYLIKPALPRIFTRLLRRLYNRSEASNQNIQWPIEPRYVNFLWEVMAFLLEHIPGHELSIKSLWPQGYRYALVLTHDVEANAGQRFIRQVANLEESLGFRSSFNFVPQRYLVDMDLVNELRERGFEIGIHGLKHDGRLFSSRAEFERRVTRINDYLKDFRAVGFRAPLTHRNPEWMQALDIEYDLSFFDTDPFEPIPGGTMSVWPFFLGHFVELPYTLVQDYTLTDVLKEDTPRLWLEKVEFIRQFCGMALVNSHPDYLRAPSRFNVYSRFLNLMREKEDYWSALPCEVARWWRNRPDAQDFSTVSLDEDGICISPQGSSCDPISYSLPLGKTTQS